MKIAVMGSHPATKLQAPFDDPEWKIYACSPHNHHDPGWGELPWKAGAPPEEFPSGRLKRFDQWFEVHPAPVRHPTRPDDYLDFVREISKDKPVWMQDRRGHPDALPYPVEKMKAEFNPFAFTSSIAYILAKAISDIAPHFYSPTPAESAIGIWGVMQGTKTEYAEQRPGIQYFLWEANRRGIDVIVPPESKLLDLPLDNW